ncbi:MAG: lamin tail domain-containing protein [Methanothrix sp.]|nr:MAG: lamin tail domain-containing protein [Methanothrix sp.]
MPVGKENVQITNLGDSSVSLAGFSLTMQDGTQFSLPSTQLNSGDFVNVYFGTGTNSDSSTYLNSKINNVLDDGYGSVTLTNNNGDKVSTLSYENTFSSLNSSPGGATVSNSPGGTTVSEPPSGATVSNSPGASTAGRTSNSK